MTGPRPSAMVIGGTAGVGRAVVDALLDRGYRVGVVARGAERLREIELAFGHERVLGLAADAGLADEVEEAADTLVTAFGAPVVWVNSAVINSFSPFEQMEVEEFDAIIRTTFLGQVNGTRAALRVMRRGHVVSIGSAHAYRSLPYQSAHSAANHAILGFNSAVRAELIRVGHPVSIAQVHLPPMNTPQFEWARNRLDRMPRPAPPVHQPEVGARAVLKCIDGEHREIWVGRGVIALILGNAVLPSWLDRRLAEEGIDPQKSDLPEPRNRPDNLMHPLPGPSAARGQFEAEADDKAAMLDGDLLRKLVFLGGPLVAFLLGLLLG